MTTRRRFGGVCCGMIAGFFALAPLSRAVALGEPILPNARMETHAMPDDKDSSEGWKILFDGKSTDAWRGFKKDRLPDGWQVVDEALVRVSGGGDIITKEQFDNFELVFEWKISEGGNSGVMFRVSEAWGATYESGPEYQVLDNAKHPDGRSKLTSAASNYAL